MSSGTRKRKRPSSPAPVKESAFSYENIVMEPYNYSLHIADYWKEFQQLVTAFDHWLKIPEAKLKLISEIIKMVHHSTIMVDDLEDNAKLRNGFAAAHQVYGLPQTLNTANYVYFLALEKTLELHPDAGQIYLEEALEIHRGQAMEMHWRNTMTCPTEDEYKAMVLQKTGCFFKFALRLLQLCSKNKTNYRPFCEDLVVYLQIRNDLTSLDPEKYEAKKDFGDDITEGKFSFPIIHGIRNKPDNHLLKNVLRNGPEDLDVKKYCARYLEEIGSMDYTRGILNDLNESLLKQVEELGGNPHFTKLIKFLAKHHEITSKRDVNGK